MTSKLVIETVGVKREVPLPAGLCLSRKQAYQIREAMEAFIGSDASYGWVTIHCDEREGAGANSKPISWTEGSGLPTNP